MDAAAARELLASASVARLATCGEGARAHPHLVPITFALDDDVIVTAVDHKPKRTTALRRLANISVNPSVSVLADHYEDDWSKLWWVRVDGAAHIVEPGGPRHADAVARLVERYEPYRDRPPVGPVIAITVSRWSGWRAAP